MGSGAIEANSKGKVYIKYILMLTEDVMKDNFINVPQHAGRCDYSIVLKNDSSQVSKITRSYEMKYIHSSRLKPGEVFTLGRIAMTQYLIY